MSLLAPSERETVRAYEASITGTDFVLDWMDFGSQRTDAPRQFHEAVGLILVATAIDRKRWLDLQHKIVYPSVYVLILAASGQRKSTPIGYGRTAITSAFPNLRLADDWSPEALIDDLGKRMPSHGTALIDEAGQLLGTMRKDRYGEGLKDLLAKLWDGPDQQTRTLRSSSWTLTDVYVNLVMAATTDRFVQLMAPEDVSSGFLVRFLPVMVTEPVVRKPITLASQIVKAQETKLVAKLKALAPGTPTAMTCTDTALARINEAEQALEAWAEQEFHAELAQPWARRLSEYVQRLAIIFAVSEGAPRIDVSQVLRAIALIDRTKESTGMLAEELTKGPEIHQRDRVERFIAQNPGISSRELQRRASMSASEAKGIAKELEELGGIRVHRDRWNREQYYPVGPGVQRTKLSACQVSVLSAGKSQCPLRTAGPTLLTTDSLTVPPDGSTGGADRSRRE